MTLGCKRLMVWRYRCKIYFVKTLGHSLVHLFHFIMFLQTGTYYDTKAHITYRLVGLKFSTYLLDVQSRCFQVTRSEDSKNVHDRKYVTVRKTYEKRTEQKTYQKRTGQKTYEKRM